MDEKIKQQVEAIEGENLKDVAGGYTQVYNKCKECGEMGMLPGGMTVPGYCVMCGYDPAAKECPRCKKVRFRKTIHGNYSCFACSYREEAPSTQNTPGSPGQIGW